MIVRIIRVLLLAAAVSIVLFIGTGFWAEARMHRVQKELSELVVRGYHASAARGEVVQPAPEPGSVRAVARCNFSLPSMVRVRTVSGEEVAYIAKGHPSFNRKAERWTFQALPGVGGQ